MKFSIAVIALVASTTYALPQGQDQWSNWSTTSPAPQGSPLPTGNGEGQGDHIVNGGQPAPTPATPQAPKDSAQDQPANGLKTTLVPLASPQLAPHNDVVNPAPAASPTPSPAVPDHKEGQSSPALEVDKTLPKPAATPDSGSKSAPDSNTDSGVDSASGSGQSGWTRWRRANVKARNNGQPERQQKQQSDPLPSSAAPQGLSQSSKASPSPDPAFQTPAANVMSKLGSDPSDTCTWDFILTCSNQAVSAGATCLTPLAEASTNCFSQTSCAASVGNNAPICATCFNSVGKQQFIKASYAGKSDSDVAPIFEAFVSFGVCDAQGNEIHA